MAGLREHERDEGRARDDLDRAAEVAIDDAEAQPAQPRNGPRAADEDLKVVDLDEVGAGGGLDEAELGRVDPLDDQPWDGDPAEPLNPAESADEDFPAERRGPSRIEND